MASVDQCLWYDIAGVAGGEEEAEMEEDVGNDEWQDLRRALQIMEATVSAVDRNENGCGSNGYGSDSGSVQGLDKASGKSSEKDIDEESSIGKELQDVQAIEISSGLVKMVGNIICTDGSGGTNQRPLLRRGGWGWVQMHNGSAVDQDSGSLAGELLTVPRAELMAKDLTHANFEVSSDHKKRARRVATVATS